MQNQRRNSDRWQHVTHIYRSIQLRQIQRSTRARAASLITDPPMTKAFIVGATWRQIFQAERSAPSLLKRVVKLLPFYRCWRPGVFRVVDSFGKDTEGD